MNRRRKRRLKRILTVWAARAAVLGLILINFTAMLFPDEEEAGTMAKTTAKTTEPETITAAPIATEPETYEVPEGPLKSQEHSNILNAEESYLLAKIAMAEAEGESTEGKAMVIMVVLNRVWAEGFPDTIEEVILQHNEKTGVYQFTPVMPGGRWWRVEPDEDCWAALELIYQGWDESEGALYFEATWNDGTWHRNNLEYIKTVGNHNFYK